MVMQQPQKTPGTQQHKRGRRFLASVEDWEKAGLAFRDIEAEVLAMLVLDCNLPEHSWYGYLERITAANIRPDDFSEPLHEAIYAAMCAVADRGQRPDLTLLDHELRSSASQHGHQYTVTDALGLTQRVKDSCDEARFEQLMDIVQEASVRRKLVAINSYATQKSADHEQSPDELIEKHITALRTAQSRYLALGAADDTIASVVDSYRGLVADWRAHPGELRGTTTGIRALDDHTRGIHRGDLWIIGARMSMGKTSLALSMALPAARACTGDHQVAIVSLEMKREALIHRLCSMLSGESATDIEDGASWVDWDAVDRALDELEVLPIRIIDAHGAASKVNGARGKMPVSEIARYARAWNQAGRLDVLFVDYLELIASPPDERKQSRDLQVGGNAIAMKALASELDIPVVLLAQAGRDTEKRASHVPTLADLRYSDESGAVADVVLFPMNWDYYRVRGQEVPPEAANKPKGVVDIFISKQRNRAAGMVSAFFLSERMQIVDYNDKRQCPVDYNGNVIVRAVSPLADR